VTPFPVGTMVRVAGFQRNTTESHDAVVRVMGVKRDELMIHSMGQSS